MKGKATGCKDQAGDPQAGRADEVADPEVESSLPPDWRA